ncbi:hypothetical protein CYY_004564 [Polysphondylium violaceum]|uniref:Protein kinase domain-containing protein n=1 Tax=Polysphondylium violaceum TaxID=133409 RepID=A0A8J4PUY5_9MYCE|nr:hypothetical protein CYY_004564 [Polysphondylium violaceum]
MEIHSVGPFIIGKTLGQGTTGKVKLGFHKDTGFKVGIKIINKELLSTKPSMRRKIEREIVLMKLIDHPNAMKMYEVYETSKYLFLILEYVEGGELFDYLVEKGGLESGEALFFFQQIITGLEYCHSRNICHRDLKPENLLLSGDKRIKIADFGMGSIVRKDALLHTSCGSPHYASPEVVSGVDYDGQKADVWSCGVILYALLTGKLPFDDENIRRLLNKVKNGAFSMPPYIHKDAQDLLTRMLIVDPSKRISIKEIKQHPWFTSNNNQIQKISPVEDIIVDPLPDVSAIDEEIFRSLMALGLGTLDEVKSSLVSNQKSTILIYYRLLEERKKFDNDVNKYGYKPKETRRASLSDMSLKKLFNGNSSSNSNNSNNANNTNNNNNSNNNSSKPNESNTANTVSSPHQQGSQEPSSSSSGSNSSSSSSGLLKQALQQHHHQQQQQIHQQQIPSISLTVSTDSNNSNNNSNSSSSSSSPMSTPSSSPSSSSVSSSPQISAIKQQENKYQRRGSMTATTNPATSPTMSHRGKTSSPIEITNKVRKLKISDSNASPANSPIIGSSPKKSWFSYFFSKNSNSNNNNNNNNNNNVVIETKIDVNLIYVNLEKTFRKYGFDWKYQNNTHCIVKTHQLNQDGTPQFECEIEIKAISSPVSRPSPLQLSANSQSTTTTTTTTTTTAATSTGVPSSSSDSTIRLSIIRKSGSANKFSNFTNSLEQLLA